LKGAKRLALQQFMPENAYSSEYKAAKPYSVETLWRFAIILKAFAGEVIVRA